MDKCSISCWLFRTLLIAATLKCSAGACQAWVPVDPNSYSTNYVSASSSDASTVRPLGFAPLTLYDDNNQGDPCISLSGIGGTGRHIELLIEAEASGSFCTRVNNGAQECESGTSTSCAGVTGDSAEYKFSCQSCEGSSVAMYYRFIVEELANGTSNYDEDWCQKRTVDFPTSLLTVVAPTNIPEPPTERGGNAGIRLYYSAGLSILSIVAWLSLLYK